MIYTDITKKAMKVCFEAHKEQKDKAGLPYVFHPFHLAEQMEDETTAAIALLHDAVEDSPLTFKDLEDMGFPERVIAGVKLMTHDPAVPYMDYVRRIRENPDARAVKLADLRHNSDLARIDHVTQKDLDRIEKYKKAIRILEED